MQSYSSDILQESGQPNYCYQTYAVGNTVVGCLLIFFPSALVLAIVLYKRYRANSTTVLERQIEVLERMWRISSKQ